MIKERTRSIMGDFTGQANRGDHDEYTGLTFLGETPPTTFVP